MVLGIKTLDLLSQFYEEEEEQEKLTEAEALKKEKQGEMADGRNGGVFRGSGGSHLYVCCLSFYPRF